MKVSNRPLKEHHDHTSQLQADINREIRKEARNQERGIIIWEKWIKFKVTANSEAHSVKHLMTFDIEGKVIAELNMASPPNSFYPL